MKTALACIALGACDWSLHRMQESPSCGVNETTPWLPHDSCNLYAPAGIVAREPVAAPPALTRALVVRGRDRFDRLCAPCHGLHGDGNSPVARAMTIRRPPSLVDATVSAFPDDRILTVITSGYGVMPSYRALTEPNDRYAILHYLRALQGSVIAFDQLPSDQRAEASRWLR